MQRKGEEKGRREKEMEFRTKTEIEREIMKGFCPPGKDLPFFSVSHANINN